MDAIELIFEGKDLTITSETLKKLGVKRGDKLQIRTVKRAPKKPVLEPANFSEEEKARRLEVVRELWGLWSEEDENAFQKTREEMWNSWTPRNLL